VEGAALRVREGRAVWSVIGAARTDYLHRMLTQDVKGIAPGQAAYACVLTPKGRILGDPLVWNLGERFVLDLDGGAAGPAIRALERTVIAEDVAFTDESADLWRAVLVGPAAGEVLGRHGVCPPGPGRFVEAAVARQSLRALRFDLGRVPAFELWGPAAAASLEAALDVPLLPPEAWDRLRVEEGVAAFGAELDDTVMPLEAGLGETAISWSKGCYPGQEPVVMARHRGHPARRLVRLAFEGTSPAPGADLLDGGQAVGRVTTVDAAGRRGLGLLRWALAEEGNAVTLPDGGTARVGRLAGD
jgi:folate-binding protein YgfZ